ncbi:MAG: hypothetical protein HWE20_15035, partial [Gammaproteobacteria bacterium]|nr:hypothetical protein [Gammaproteobacteria bacterium]
MTRLFFLFLVMLCAPLRAEFAVSGGSGKINSAIAEVGQALAHLDSAQLETLLSQALQSYGYYQAKADIQGEGNNRKVKLTMGPTVKISAVNLDIPPTVRNLDAVKTLLESKPFKVNSALDHATYEQFKTTLNDALGDHGFIENTSVEGQILVDRVKRTAEINITVKTGARATFGKVIGPEDDEIKLAVLQSWATFQAGEPYDIAQIEAFSELLYTAGFFDTVYVSPEPNPETQAVDVKINGKYKAEYIGAFGLGVSTDSGLRTSFDLQAPHSHSNGHSAALHAEVALEQQSLDMRWRVPRDKNPNHHFNELKLGWQQNKASAVPSRT